LTGDLKTGRKKRRGAKGTGLTGVSKEKKERKVGRKKNGGLLGGKWPKRTGREADL